MSEINARTAAAIDTGPAIAVTGASSGIGLELCRQLADAGWRVFALDVSLLQAQALAAAQPPGRVVPIACDVGSAQAVAQAFATVAQHTVRLDALVCSAGVLRTAPLMEMQEADFNLLFAVNTRGPWLCAKSALPLLQAGASADVPGRIVMLASIAALRPKVGGGAYAASKAALNRLVRVMAVELGPAHVRVNAVAPATVDTPMISGVEQGDGSGYKASGLSPLGRISTAGDIVQVIRFLLSPASNYINGAMIPVDGGTSAAFVAPGVAELR